MDFIISTQYFTLYHVFIQDVNLTQSSQSSNICGVLQIGVDLYNNLLGNTYLKNLRQLRYSLFYFYFNMYIFGG